MLKIIFTYITIISVGAIVIVGCGGSNPVAPETEPTELKVDLDLSKEEASPGDTIQITATVKNPQKYEKIDYTWINITKYGTLSATDTNQNVVLWKAPDHFDIHEIRIEIIKLVVTAIFGDVTITDDRVKTDTKVLTAAKNVTIKIIS